MRGEERSISESCYCIKSIPFSVNPKSVNHYLQPREVTHLATWSECHKPSNAFITVTIPGSVLALICALDMKGLLKIGVSVFLWYYTCSKISHTQCHSRLARRHHFPVKILHRNIVALLQSYLSKMHCCLFAV